MREAFSMDFKPQIEGGEYSLTCDGKPVQIVKWDCKGDCPILGVIEGEDGKDEAWFFTEQGCTQNEKYWLYVDKPNNYNEVEWAIASLIEKIDGDYALFMSHYDEYIKEFAPIIMKAAEDLMHRVTNGNYAWLIGKEDAYKNMPKWKKVKDGQRYSLGFTIDEYDSGCEVLCKDDHEIDVKELWEKLEKEE